MCNCIEKVNEILKKQDLQLNTTVNLTNGKSTVGIYAEAQKIPKRGNRHVYLEPVYCPFCGEKY